MNPKFSFPEIQQGIFNDLTIGLDGIPASRLNHQFDVEQERESHKTEHEPNDRRQHKRSGNQ
jgi:hypothetical protein